MIIEPTVTGCVSDLRAAGYVNDDIIIAMRVDVSSGVTCFRRVRAWFARLDVIRFILSSLFDRSDAHCI